MLNTALFHARVRLENTLFKRVMRLPDRWLYRLGGGEAEVRDDRTLDAQMQLIAFADRQMRPLHTYPVREMRERYEYVSKMMGPFEQAPVFTTRRLIALDSEAGGKRQLEVHLYCPERGPFPKPVLVYYHGGGWCMGSPQSHSAFCKHIAAEADMIVVNVDYRLAPEHPFPLPAEDAIDAYRWVRENAAQMAGREDCILVAGDSAGGNLAAVVCQQALTRGFPAPQGQVLIYPATDLRQSHDSYLVMGKGYVLTDDWMDWFISHYLGDTAKAALPLASPLLGTADDLKGVAPALIFTCGFDVLRDEGEAYAKALLAQQVPVKHHEFPQLLHGFCGMMGVSMQARAASDEVCAQIRELLARIERIQS